MKRGRSWRIQGMLEHLHGEDTSQQMYTCASPPTLKRANQMSSLEHKVKLPDLTGPGFNPPRLLGAKCDSQACLNSAAPPSWDAAHGRVEYQLPAKNVPCLLPICYSVPRPKSPPRTLGAGRRNYCLVLVRFSLSRPLLRLSYGRQDSAK
jgi:hypothetical protein